jgi:hypothetical protein
MTRLEDKMDEVNKNMLKLILTIQTVKSRIEGQMPLFPTTATTKTEAKVVDKPIIEREIVALSEADEVDSVGSGGKKNVNIPT